MSEPALVRIAAPPEPIPVLVAGSRSVTLTPGTSLLVGTDPTCDLPVQGPGVRPRHAVLRCRGRGLEIGAVGDAPLEILGTRSLRGSAGPGAAIHLGRVSLVVAEGPISRRAPDAVRWHDLVVRDPRSLRLLQEIARVASVDAPVFVHGESGSGKELCARALHLASSRASRPYVAVNCAALPPTLAEAELFGVVKGAFTGADRSRPGAFQRADGGTLLLDEIGELPGVVQAKLLRVLESGETTPVGGDEPVPIDVRVLSSTWRDLPTLAEEGSFRVDLLHRLCVLRIDVPALRERPGDVAPLLDLLLRRHGAEDLWPDPRLLARLEAATWAGNVRALRNRVLRTVVAGRAETLLVGEAETEAPVESAVREPRSPESWNAGTYGDRVLAALSAGEGLLPRRGAIPDREARIEIEAALAASRGNRTRAAMRLGISRATLYRWLSVAGRASAPAESASEDAAGGRGVAR